MNGPLRAVRASHAMPLHASGEETAAFAQANSPFSAPVRPTGTAKPTGTARPLRPIGENK